MSYRVKSLGQDDGAHRARVRQNIAAAAAVGVLGIGLLWYIGRETSQAYRAGRGRRG